jgi:iron complex outermembrane receptor protein
MSEPPRKFLKYRQHRFERHGTGHQLLKDWTWITDDDNGVYVNGVLNGGESPTAYTTSEVSGSTPKYGLSYHVSPDVMTYATVSKGYREGGPLFQLPNLCTADLANLGPSASPTAYKPDSIWNYELGAKTEWPDHRLTINGAVYYIDWTNIQQTIALPTCGFVFTGNFGTASSKGTEFEMNYEPTAALKLIQRSQAHVHDSGCPGPGRRDARVRAEMVGRGPCGVHPRYHRRHIRLSEGRFQYH